MPTDNLICGVDEVGRGCIAGIVVAAAVILPQHYTNKAIKDSKQLNATQRKELDLRIRQDAIALAIGESSVKEIDQYNILQATFKAMHRAISQLNPKPKHLDIDGNRFASYPHIPHRCNIKGDQTKIHIAAASILAKVYRDAYMVSIGQKYKPYNWGKNKGYPTIQHKKAVLQYGRTEHHRQLFRIELN